MADAARCIMPRPAAVGAGSFERKTSSEKLPRPVVAVLLEDAAKATLYGASSNTKFDQDVRCNTSSMLGNSGLVQEVELVQPLTEL